MEAGTGGNDAQHQPGVTALTEAASSAHSHRPGVIATMYRDQLTFDPKTGDATNVKDVIEQARREVPELFSITGNGNAGTQGSGGGGADMNSLIRRSAGRPT